MNDVAWCGRLFGISRTGSQRSPLAHDAVDLVAVRRRREAASGRSPTSNSSIGSDTPFITQWPCDCICRLGLAEGFARLGREQGLPAARERHHARGGGLGQAVDLQRLGAARHVLGAVLAQDDRPDVQTGARLQRHRQRGERAVVAPARSCTASAARVEQQQHAVGLVDLAPAPLRQQVARHAVVRGPDLGHRGVADAPRTAWCCRPRRSAAVRESRPCGPG